MKSVLQTGCYALCLVTASLVVGCGTRAKAIQEATDKGYKLGTSDSIKRQYWFKQALERRTDSEEHGRRVYYTFEDQELTADGRKTVPRKKTISVIE